MSLTLKETSKWTSAILSTHFLIESNTFLGLTFQKYKSQQNQFSTNHFLYHIKLVRWSCFRCCSKPKGSSQKKGCTWIECAFFELVDCKICHGQWLQMTNVKKLLNYIKGNNVSATKYNITTSTRLKHKEQHRISNPSPFLYRRVEDTNCQLSNKKLWICSPIRRILRSKLKKTKAIPDLQINNRGLYILLSV